MHGGLTMVWVDQLAATVDTNRKRAHHEDKKSLRVQGEGSLLECS